MCRVDHRLALVAVVILSLCYPGRTEPLPTDGKSAPAGTKPVRTDLYGDPLPPGALARMGTVQFCGSAAAFAPDSSVLALGDGSSLRLWSLETGKLLLHVKENYEPGPMMFSPDGKWLATSGTQSICLLDAATGKLVRRIPAKTGMILAFSPDSKLAVTRSQDTSLLLWHTATGQQAFQLGGHEHYPYRAAFAPDGRTLVTLGTPSQGGGKTIVHWDLSTRTQRKAVDLQFPRVSMSLELSPDGQTLAVAQKSSTEPVRLWDTATGKERLALQGDGAVARQVAFSQDNRTLATAWAEANAREGTLSLWDAATGKRLRRFPILGREVGAIQFSPDGRTLLADYYDARVHLWDIATGQPRWQRDAHDKEVWSLSFTPDGRKLVSGALDGTIRVWDTADGKQERQLAAHRWGSSLPAAVMPDGRAVLSSGVDGCPRLLALHTSKELRRFSINEQPEKLTKHQVSSLGLAADGRTAAASIYRTDDSGSQLSWLLHVWDLSTGQILVNRALTSEKHATSFSPDAKLMVGYIDPERMEKKEVTAEEPSGSALGVWEVATGRQVLAIPQPDSRGFCTAFSPDGQTLTTLTSRSVREGDGYRVDRHTIHLWELATGKERLAITNDENGQQFDYTRITFGPDGRTFATARWDKTLQLWDVATGQELLRRTGYETEVLSLAYAPDGKTLATGHEDSTILLWDLAPETWRRPSAVPPPAAQELEAAWMQLANPEARKAHTAIWRLIAVPRQAVSLLRVRLRPASAVSADRLRQLLRGLDSSQFRERETAAKQLADLEEQAEAALQNALKGNPPAEQRRRAEALLAGPRVVRSPEKLRSLRAIQVLEQCDLPEARQVLESLAQGDPEARLTQEAKASLQRLAGRHAATP